MDAREFEALSRRVAHLAGRRSLLRAVIAAPVVARITVAEDGEAKRKRRRKKKGSGSPNLWPALLPMCHAARIAWRLGRVARMPIAATAGAARAELASIWPTTRLVELAAAAKPGVAPR
jgi:hypothetical protein